MGDTGTGPVELDIPYKVGQGLGALATKVAFPSFLHGACRTVAMHWVPQERYAKYSEQTVFAAMSAPN